MKTGPSHLFDVISCLTISRIKLEVIKSALFSFFINFFVKKSVERRGILSQPVELNVTDH